MRVNELKMKTLCQIIFLFFFINSISSLNKQRDCKCRILPGSKIVGGNQANHLAYPWIVSISNKPDITFAPFRRFVDDESKLKFHSCGGSIINEHWILTAAHCVPDDKSKPLFVGFGNDNDLTKIFDFGRIKSVRIIKNPEFEKSKNILGSSNDIALVQLEKPIKFSDHVKPACFSSENQKLYPGFLEHAGWGATNVVKIDSITGQLSNIIIPKNLKEMYLVDESDTRFNCKINEKVICAKGMVENESSCKGDSGGPVHYTKNGKSYVVGITSFSNDIHIKNDIYHLCVGSTVYTRVTSFIDWMKYYVGDEICDF